MTRWARATRVRFCGRCAGRIDKGAPILVIGLANVKREHIRGECCAGPAPPDLPAHLERVAAPVSLERLGLLPLDWRREREPGEDD